jgi:hypothetical protein
MGSNVQKYVFIGHKLEEEDLRQIFANHPNIGLHVEGPNNDEWYLEDPVELNDLRLIQIGDLWMGEKEEIYLAYVLCEFYQHWDGHGGTDGERKLPSKPVISLEDFKDRLRKMGIEPNNSYDTLCEFHRS